MRMDFKIMEGKVVKGPFWKEPVKITKAEYINGGEYLHLIGSTLYSKEYVEDILDKSQIGALEVIDESINFSYSPKNLFYYLEALRFKNASLFDPLLAVSVSKIHPLPFQIEAVYGYILKQPRIRFLIADDPGAGKTIMAGLVIKEMKLRGLVQRILIVVPGHLKDQWKREMKDRFKEVFVEFNRSSLEAHYGENPLERNDQVIASLDFLKQDDILPILNSAHWDLVIVDEAHKMAAYRYGDKVQRTQRYKLGEVLSRNSDHLLFLTATPHRGDPENFRLFLDLLVPGFFAKPEMIEESLKNKDNPLFIRRLKEDLRDFEGRPIFTNRYPKTIRFRLSEKEQELYLEVTRYVREQYNKAMSQQKNRNLAFALMILQRRMASSTYALLRSLERRKERLEKLLKDAIKPVKISLTDLETVEDLEEEERWKKEEEWETVSLAKDPEELRREIEILERLIEKAYSIIHSENEVKLSELKKAIEEGFKKIEEMQGNPKILIFTESKDTLEYLVGKIKSWGYSVNFIHGGMSLPDRIKEEKRFRDETQIMVATEAAGEGINLQFCHIMINYDIPWNPNRLEQRMGRIHRYGQQKDVYIFNLVAEDTVEGKVLSRMFEKLEEIREKLGSDRVFDVIGEVFHGKNLYQLIIEAVTKARTLEEVLKEMDIKPDESYLRNIREILGESLATRFIDYTKIRDIAEKAKEYRLIPEYVEEFFKRVFKEAGGSYRELRDGFIAIDSIPYEIKKIADSQDFKNRFGDLDRRYPKATFDSQKAFENPDAEFISFGHPLLEALIEWTLERFREGVKKGAVFKDPSGILKGYIWFYIAQVKDGKGAVAGRKVLAIYESEKEIREVNPSILWDLKPSERTNVDANADENRIKGYVINAVKNYRDQLQKEREREASIKEKYGVRSLQILIADLDAELTELYERQARGERVDLPIRNKEERKRRYEEALKELKKEIEREKTLTLSMPELITVIRVLPQRDEMSEDEEVERIAMEIAMEYERSQGREPEDVSKENLGFDIRSKGKDGVRYIEVKGRAKEGDVALTPNEWFKARRFKDQYYLYVVYNAVENPKLVIIQNPAQNLEPTEVVETVRFIVKKEDILGRGEVV